mgnify:FL=1|jgi:signal transduction histidine kinase|tara:strand:+ start:757 stop:2073 length:1317 start_codon:yes stop_codon:yes gene_type:complete
MRLQNNLRLRFIISFVGFSLLITASFAIIITVLKAQMAEEFFMRRLQSELQYFADRYQQDLETPLPIAEDIGSFLGTSKMPEYLRSTVLNLSDGVYDLHFDPDEFYDRKDQEAPDDEEKYVHYFGIKTLHDGKKVYIFIDFEFWRQKEDEIMVLAFWSYFAVFLVALAVGWFTASRVIYPLKKLMRVIENTDPDNLPSGFSKMFKEDEIGALARAFETLFTRIKAFVHRENQFTRDASHELRTPVTVIKGAVELLKMSQSSIDAMTEKLVNRIDRSSRDMETTVESLLWLARETGNGGQTAIAELKPVIENAIEQNKHLLTGKDMDMKFEVEATPTIKAPVGVATIAVSNLIRNACQFTSKGSITITLSKDRVEVEDTGTGIPSDKLGHVKDPGISENGSQGFGFGLDIVNRLCAKFGWSLIIESELGKGTKSSIIFT